MFEWEQIDQMENALGILEDGLINLPKGPNGAKGILERQIALMKQWLKAAVAHATFIEDTEQPYQERMEMILQLNRTNDKYSAELTRLKEEFHEALYGKDN